jgi:hypothetical protein
MIHTLLYFNGFVGGAGSEEDGFLDWFYSLEVGS